MVVSDCIIKYRRLRNATTYSGSVFHPNRDKLKL